MSKFIYRALPLSEQHIRTNDCSMMSLKLLSEASISDIDSEIYFDDKNMNKSISEIENKFNIRFLGSGDNAIVFSLDDDSVLKITSSYEDYKNLKKVQNKKLKGLPEIENVINSNYNDNIFFIVMKNYDILPKKWRLALRGSGDFDPISYYVDDYNKLNQEDLIELSQDYNLPVNEVIDFFEIFNNLKNLGINITDLKVDNFMWDRNLNCIVMVDLSDTK